MNTREGQIIEILFNAIKDDQLTPDERMKWVKSSILKLDPSICNSVDSILDENGYTPLIMAVIKNRANIVDFLLQNKADPNQHNEKEQKTALIYAAHYNHTTTVKMLLKNKADPDFTCTTVTPLIKAILEGHQSIVTILLKKKADANLKNVFAVTPVMHAATNTNKIKSTAIVSLLLQYGAKFTNVGILHDFLSSQDQCDIHVSKCLSYGEEQKDNLNDAQLYTLQLSTIHNTYQTWLCFLLPLPSEISGLILAYSGSFTPTKALKFFEPETADMCLRELAIKISPLNQGFFAETLKKVDSVLALQKKPLVEPSLPKKPEPDKDKSCSLM